MKRIVLALSALFIFSASSMAEQKIVNIGLSAASVAYSTGAIRSVSLGGYSAIPGGNIIAGMGFSYTVPTDKIVPVTATSFEGPRFGIGPVYISSGTKIFVRREMY